MPKPSAYIQGMAYRLGDSGELDTLLASRGWALFLWEGGPSGRRRFGNMTGSTKLQPKVIARGVLQILPDAQERSGAK